MSVVNAIPLIAAGDDGYSLSRSLRFRSSASAYLNRTPATASNRTTWSWSGWVKRGKLGAYQILFSTYGNSTNVVEQIRLYNSDVLNIEYYSTSSFVYQLLTTQVFRDPAAWYHIVVAMDTTQATASNRIKIYVNGTQVTSFSTATYPAQNTNTLVDGALPHYIGVDANNGLNSYYDGYMAEVNFIDGQALAPSSFGEFSIYNQWLPKKYAGSYGTNGFYLPFTNNASAATLGNDFSGNSNTWTTNNISVTTGSSYDSTTDVPTLTSATAANWCVLNPLDKDPDITMSNGNLTATAATGVHNNARSTMGCGTTGYWYMEFAYTGGLGGSTAIAVGLYDPTFRIDNGTHPVTTGDGFYGLYASSGSSMYTNGNTPTVTVSTGSAGDILQLAYDVAGGKLWYGLNNVWYDSAGGTTGNPSTGANATITTVATNRIFGFDIVSNTINFNFGQRPFAYTPPTGYLALNTFNL